MQLIVAVTIGNGAIFVQQQRVEVNPFRTIINRRANLEVQRFDPLLIRSAPRQYALNKHLCLR